MDETVFWDEYARRYGDDRGNLAKDGAGLGYKDSPRMRILAVLKEPNNSPGADLRDDFLNGGAKWAIWHRLSEWVAGILHGFPPYDDVHNNSTLKNDALRRIAVVNLKKLSGGASIDEGTLQRFAFRDRDLLREQINALKPTLILACGTFNPLLWLLEDRITPQADLGGDVIPLEGETYLIRWRHPSRCSGQASYERLQKLFTSSPACVFASGGSRTLA